VCISFQYNNDGPSFDEIFYFLINMYTEAGINVDKNQLVERVKLFKYMAAISNKDKPLKEWLEKIDSMIELRKCLKLRTMYQEDINDWDNINQCCEDNGTLYNYTLYDFACCHGNDKTITLTTLHSSKGLEYKVVIMPGLEQGRMPGYGAQSDAALKEARRVFYVGMTRAKDRIYFLYSGWYQNRYGRIWENGESQFIKELQIKMKQTRINN
jgi:DNA helicase-2/ATP-dependent DNA helicase PcrA